MNIDELSEQLTDAVERVLNTHASLDNDSRCSCGARNNMDGDVLDSHRISLVGDAIDSVLAAAPGQPPGDEQRMRIAAVRRLHQQYRPAFDHPDVCSHCTRGMDLVNWPCPTIQALDSST